MPAYLTHRVAAQSVLEKTENGKIKNVMAFYLGSQGPDVLFFRNFQPWRNSTLSLTLGIDMHSKHVRSLFEHGLEYVRNYKGDDRDELVSYMAGMVVHYAIDKNAHPFVYDKSGADSALHNRIEFMWDSIITQETWGTRADEYEFRKEILYSKLGDGVCDWYCDAAKQIYDTKITPSIVREAQRHYAIAKQSLNNIRFFGKIALRFASRFLKFDTHSLQYPEKIEYTLFSKEEYEDMKKLIEKGVDESAQMVKFALDYFEADVPTELPEWFGDVDFSGNGK